MGITRITRITQWRSPLSPALRLIGALVVLCLSVSSARAQDLTCGRGDREVHSLKFEGNQVFSDLQLAQLIVTAPSTLGSRLHLFGTKRCLDPVEFERDILRLRVFYVRRGYPRAQVDTVVRTLAPHAIEVVFRVHEGPPIIIRSLRITGLDSVPNRDEILRDFPLHVGGVFDRFALDSGQQTVVRRLQDSGYPKADALKGFESDTSLRASVELNVVPGPRVHLGQIRIAVEPYPRHKQEVPAGSVRRTLGLKTGDLYSERAIIEAQRNLYQTDAYRRVSITRDSLQSDRDSLLNLTVSLAEGLMHTANVSTGWATLDCFRAQAELIDRDFLPWAQRLELSTRVSKIGIGRPLDGARALCSDQARQDRLYSSYLNYYAGATIRQPVLFKLRRIPTITVYSSQLSEYKAFLRRTPIGMALSVTNPLQHQYESALSYSLELGRTEAEPALFCAVFSVCDSTRLDLQRNNRLAAIGYTVARVKTNNPLDPTKGTSLRLELRHASQLIGSDRNQQFNRAVTDGTWYGSLSNGTLLTAHVKLGTVFSGSQTLTSGGRFVPPAERLYAGGPTTVRGFRQNELGPVVYIVDTFDVVRGGGVGDSTFQALHIRAQPRTVPVGGNMLVVGNLEAQFRSPVLTERLRLALFTDGGQVWNRGGNATIRLQTFRVTPGVGLRALTPIGVIRVDLGYNGYESEPGAAYYYAPATGGGTPPLYCVSPGNRFSPNRPEEGSCPATFRPTGRKTFLGRLNPSLWIGQAF